MSDDFILPPRPPLTLTIGDKTIKMTYGLEMDLRRLLPDAASTITLLQTDMYTQDYVVRRIMTDTKKMVTDVNELIPVEDLDITSEDTEKILGWATEHALYFFVKRTIDMSKLGATYMSVLPKPSTNGSESSASTTPSAGDSES